MRTGQVVSVVSLVATIGLNASVATASGKSTLATEVSSAQTLLNRYCITCHNDRLETGGLSLQSVDPAHVDQHAEIWEKVVRKVRSGVMPPDGHVPMKRLSLSLRLGSKPS